MALPPRGDSWFVNQQRVLSDMPTELRAKLASQLAIHSAKAAYVPDGMYVDGEADSDKDARELCGSLLISLILLLSKNFSSI
ncbi:MAG: hypothetical protein ACI9SB_002793 [Candidatus Azotimanducaceae bacterium]